LNAALRFSGHLIRLIFMSVLGPLFRWTLLILVLGGVTGCLPVAERGANDENNPHFLAGKSKVRSMDYQGAVRSFERALQVNPNSAAAHKELGLLYEKELNDYAAAIYHYGKFLELRPDSPQKELLQQHIAASKQELARTVSLGPVTQGIERDLSVLAGENERLKQENLELRRRVEELKQQLARRNSASNAPPPTGQRVMPTQPPDASHAYSSYGDQSGGNGGSTETSSSRYQMTHTVKKGDTLYSISQRYGVELDDIKAANPGLQPHRMKVGHKVNIPIP
jgi:LysM repeat protein